MSELHKADLALAKSLLKGDESAFTVFYNTYFPRIYRFCKLRVEDSETCKDIVQQSLTNAMRSIHTYRGEASLLTWLNQISRNEISAWYKKTGHSLKLQSSMDDNPNLLAALESIPSGIEGEQIDLHDDGIKALVQLTLDNLPSSYGKVLELKYIEGQSVMEIAQYLNLGEVAVQSLLARARKAFKEIFTDLEKEYRTA